MNSITTHSSFPFNDGFYLMGKNIQLVWSNRPLSKFPINRCFFLGWRRVPMQPALSKEARTIERLLYGAITATTDVTSMVVVRPICFYSIWIKLPSILQCTTDAQLTTTHSFDWQQFEIYFEAIVFLRLVIEGSRMFRVQLQTIIIILCSYKWQGF